MPIFLDQEDQDLYLDILWWVSKRHGVAILAYCLMTNHVHHLAVPETKRALSEVFKRTHQLYARKINRREGWLGHFWQERFYSDPLGPCAAWQVIRYILMNPVRAGLVKRPEDWLFSSARQHLGIEPVRPLLKAEQTDRIVGDWRVLLSRDVDPEVRREIRLATRRGDLLLAEGRSVRPNSLVT